MPQGKGGLQDALLLGEPGNELYPPNPRRKALIYLAPMWSCENTTPSSAQKETIQSTMGPSPECLPEAHVSEILTLMNEG